MNSIFKKATSSTQVRANLIGYAIRNGEQSPLEISTEQLLEHSVIFGSAGTGKTTLMSHLAYAAINFGLALVVIDMDGDLVPNLVGLVPVDRVNDVCWIDLTNKEGVPALNLLELGRGEDANFILENLVGAGPWLWGDYWKPDVEDAFCISVRTLLAANQVLVERNKPQFSLLDIVPLFEYPDFCRRLLKDFVIDPDLIEWWKPYLGRPSWVNAYDFAALLTPLRRVESNHQLAMIIAQPDSTIDLLEFLQPRRINLINLHSDTLDLDIRHWFAALITDRINLLGLGREELGSKMQPGVVIAVNGDLLIPRLSEPELLAYLRKRGISYILTNWSSPHPESSDETLRRAILANAKNFFIFRCGSSDAEILSRVLSDVMATDIVKLPRRRCLARIDAHNRDLFGHPVAGASRSKGFLRAAKSILGRFALSKHTKTKVNQNRPAQQWLARSVSWLRQVRDSLRSKR